jgi:exopolyphosphatase/guanosine-5'-triphosphate,3'-diphosphate pyrophosphatase
MYASALLSPAAMRRTVAACTSIGLINRRLGVQKCVAVMTAAGREARNGKTLVKQLHAAAGIKPVILSGKKEAGLIYSGILGAVNPGRKKILIIEIGGGSTELASGRGASCDAAVALNMGAVRMKHIYPVIGGRKPVPQAAYRRIVSGLEISLRPRLKQFTGRRFDLVFGSAGTIRAIADIFSRLQGCKVAANKSISLRQVGKIALCLCALSLTQRKKLLHVQPDRADIIIGGAAILEAIMSVLKIRSIRVSHCGLREGLILNAYPSLPAGKRPL